MFIQRIDGVIVAVYASPQPGVAEEFLPESDQQVQDFYERLKGATNE